MNMVARIFIKPKTAPEQCLRSITHSSGAVFERLQNSNWSILHMVYSHHNVWVYVGFSNLSRFADRSSHET